MLNTTDDDDPVQEVLALPVARFLDTPNRGSVRAMAALRAVAGHLGATVMRELCTREADLLVQRMGGRTVWREAVNLVGQWLDDRADEMDEVDDLLSKREV